MSKSALLIANSDYADSRLASLVAPGADIEAFATVLRDPSIGNFDAVTTLVNRPEGPLRREIAKFLQGRAKDDLVLLYFSGHGVLDDEGHLHFAATDTDRDSLNATAVSAGFLRKECDRCYSRRQVLILDCCHGGAYVRGSKSSISVPEALTSVLGGQGYGRVVLAASDSTQFAWDGERAIGEPSLSAFTSVLVQGLRTGDADTDNDGVVTVSELFDFISSRLTTARQRPVKFADGEQGRLVIAANPRPRASELPSDLRDAVTDPRTFVREGAVRELAKLIGASHPGRALSAHAALVALAGDDSRTVAQFASHVLSGCEIRPVAPVAVLEASQPAPEGIRAINWPELAMSAAIAVTWFGIAPIWSDARWTEASASDETSAVAAVGAICGYGTGFAALLPTFKALRGVPKTLMLWAPIVAAVIGAASMGLAQASQDDSRAISGVLISAAVMLTACAVGPLLVGSPRGLRWHPAQLSVRLLLAGGSFVVGSLLFPEIDGGTALAATLQQGALLAPLALAGWAGFIALRRAQVAEFKSAWLISPLVIALLSLMFGGVRGTVADASGAVIPGAYVTLGSCQTVTNVDGGFSASVLCVPARRILFGTETIRVELKGFRTTETEMRIVPGSKRFVRLTVAVGASTESDRSSAPLSLASSIASGIRLPALLLPIIWLILHHRVSTASIRAPGSGHRPIPSGPWYRRSLLLYKPHTALAWAIHGVFYLSLTVTVAAPIGLFLEDERFGDVLGVIGMWGALTAFFAWCARLVDTSRGAAKPRSIARRTLLLYWPERPAARGLHVVVFACWSLVIGVLILLVSEWSRDRNLSSDFDFVAVGVTALFFAVVSLMARAVARRLDHQ